MRKKTKLIRVDLVTYKILKRCANRAEDMPIGRVVEMMVKYLYDMVDEGLPAKAAKSK